MAVIEKQVPAGTGVVPLTVEQYHRMIETGILPEGEPIELLDGLPRRYRSRRLLTADDEIPLLLPGGDRLSIPARRYLA